MSLKEQALEYARAFWPWLKEKTDAEILEWLTKHDPRVEAFIAGGNAAIKYAQENAERPSPGAWTQFEPYIDIEDLREWAA